jgi:hypothetical protein
MLVVYVYDGALVDYVWYLQADQKEFVVRVDRVVTRVLGELVAYLRLGSGINGVGGYSGGGWGDRAMIELFLHILEHHVGKGTAERTEGNGRDTTFWEITEGAPWECDRRRYWR